MMKNKKRKTKYTNNFALDGKISVSGSIFDSSYTTIHSATLAMIMMIKGWRRCTEE